MKKAFNLQKFLKTAFYDDGRGYWNTLSRAWANCYKIKSNEGKGAQDAWMTCKDEYQKTASKGKWALDYGSIPDEGKRPDFSAKTPDAEKILKKK